MELFNSLLFRPKLSSSGTIAAHTFDNSYGVSVITDGYGNSNAPYEVAITLHGDITYESYITDGVLGWLTDKDVDVIMHRVKALPNK